MSAQFKRLDKVRILEAGSGSNSAFDFADNSYLVGLDIEQQQLERNETLDEKHQGDVQNYSFPPDSFDMIICWNVLEHLPRPDKALDNFAKWLAPGGIIILALPNLLSTIGLATKYTPHWFHIFWYRHVCHVADAGKDGRGPFRTFLRPCLSLPRLKQFAEERGLSTRFTKAYGGKGRKGMGGRLRSCFKMASYPLEILSLCRISASKDAIMVVFEK